jgi:hypothetical protein
VLFFTGLYLGFVGLVVIGRWLDHILFPGFRKVDVGRPVFLIAPPRSGTSFLQKALNLDEKRFVYWKMYQTIFPSVCFYKLFEAIQRLDAKLGGYPRRLLEGCERKWFGGWDDLHRMRLDQPEEDHALFLYAFAAEAIFMLFPFVEELWEVGFPDALPPRDRRKLMAYYRSCLQRQAYAHGGGRTLLVKSTHASGCVEAIREEFPEARFITVVRHPYESIPSHVSLFVPAWQAHSPEIAKDGPESRAYAGLAVAWYRHLFRFRSKVAPENFYSLDYRDLRADPGRAIRDLYRHFGWTMSDTYRARLEETTSRQRTFRSRHEYSLEEFGLSEQWIQSELAPVMEAYGLAPASPSFRAAAIEGGRHRHDLRRHEPVPGHVQQP